MPNNSHKKKNKNTRKTKKIKIIENKTPFRDQILAKTIKINLDKFPSNLKNSSPSSSFSPSVNKYLVSKSISTPETFNICNNNLLKINISTKKNSKCLDYNDPKVKTFLLNNLKKTKINCSEIIPPKQILSNCWFNTLFVTFFISDKGRKFFKFFRQLMIEGRQINGELIPPELAKAFFIFNLAIEASHNHLLKNIAYSFDTNLLIKQIYQIINANTIYKNSNIYQVDDAGHPFYYYQSIIQYLNNNNLNIIKVSILDNNASSKYVSNIITNNLHDVIILEIYDYGEEGAGPSKYIKNKELTLNIHNVKYSLDSCVIRDTTGSHFCSLLTCNKEEYSYDGASYSRLNQFKWKSWINKSKLWGFKGHDLTWNFRNGYQMLFYYRI